MTEVMIRELTASDRAAVAYELRHMGERSMFQRYLRVASPVAETARLTHLDHWHHDALIALSRSPRVPIGLVEYVRLQEFDTAELAISVVDGWQRQGVGRELAFALRSRALAAGIRRFRATMMRGNLGALALARALGRLTLLKADATTADWLIEL